MKKSLLVGLISAFSFLLSNHAIAQIPVASFSLNLTTACAGSTVQITDQSTGSPTSWLYTMAGGQPTASALQNPVVTFSAAGIYTITLVSANATGPSIEMSQTISVIAVPVLTVSGITAICNGASATQTVSGANTYSWSTGATTNTETLTPASTTIYTITGTNTLTGCSSAMPLVITVNPLPALAVSGSSALCTGASITQTLSGADTYSWNTVATGNTISISPTANTSYTVTGSNTLTGCTSSTSLLITVNPLPALAIAGGNSVCAGSAITKTVSGADTYLWSNTAITNIISVSPTANTVYSVTGTNTLTGCSAMATASVNAIALPSLTLTGVNAFCTAGTSTQTVSGADTYSWSTGATTNTETFTPAVTTTYTVTGTNTLTGCSSSAPVVITINALPVLSVSGNSAVCLGSSITQSLSGANTYSWNGTATGNTISIAPTGNTTYTVTGTNTLTGCTSSTTVLITVNSLPTVSIAGGTIVCAGSAITQTASGADTYLWSNATASNVASFNPTASIVYSVTGTSTLTGCSAMATTTITAVALPSLTLTGVNAFCVIGTATQTVSGADTYLWSTGATVNTETFAPAVTTTYTVTGTNTLTGCSSSAPVVITVNALPVLTVSGGNAVCPGTSITQSFSGADTYSWNGIATGNTISISPALNTTYTLAGTNTLTGCSNSITISIAVNAPPTIVITGNNTTCAGSAVTQTASGADTYLWSNATASDVASFSPTATTVYSVTGTSALTGCSAMATTTITAIALPSLTLTGVNAFCVIGTATQTVSGADTYSWSTGATVNNETFSPTLTTTYTVSGTNTLTGCTNSAPVVITVNALPVITISGNTAVCLGTPITQTLSGANTYSWNAVASGSVFSINPAVNTTYTAVGTNTLTGCSNTASVSIVVNAIPVIAITGGNSVCAGSAITQTVSGTDTYLWSNAATGTVATFNPLASAIYSVTGTSTLTGCSVMATTSITAVALPSLTLTGVNAFCAVGTATQTVSGADTYLWSTGTTSNTETFAPAITTTYNVTGTNTITGCSNSAPVVITVNAIPVINVNSGAVCAGDVFTMTPGGASTYTFSNGSATVIPTANTSYSVTGTSSAGCISSNTAVAGVTVNPLPSVAVNSGAMCIGGSFTITPSGASNYTISGNSATVSPVVTTSYIVTGTSAEGCPAANTATCYVTVNVLPFIYIAGNSTICVGQTSTLTASGASTYTWNSTVINPTFTANPVTNTSYTVSGTDNNGCSNTSSQLVTVSALPTLTVSGGTICLGGSYTLMPTGANNYTYSGGSGIVSPATTSAYTITGMDAAGCISTPAVVTVSVANAVTLSVSGNLAICKGSPAYLTANGAVSYVWSNGPTTASMSASPLANTSYTVTGTDGPCTNMTVVSVTVNNLPDVKATSTQSAICAGQTIVLSADGASTYTWSNAATGPNIPVTPQSDASYSVVGTDLNGCVNSASITESVFDCTGISTSAMAAQDISLYPNPNNGDFVIDVQEDMQLSIMNAVGQVVYSTTLQKGTNHVNLEDQAKGIYFVSLKQAGHSKTIKMIRN